ncbi:MAG: type II toxin-antitoxin system VapC family toxin [Methylophilus sp.]|uniref:type II toxin-antitoxin system VapC family toxin n=1 Tax=Methylophilus sp. TaxID=29541 RepID=UPI003FA09454
MNLVDSCGWLEYFANGNNADFFAPVLEDTEHLLVPALVVYEVCKRVALQRGEAAASSAADFMSQGMPITFDADTALSAALYAAKHKLALADSLILQTAKEHGALLWTQDVDLKDHDGVKYIAKTV